MRCALVIVDMQVDYFNDDELGRCRDDLVATCNALVGAARGAGCLVVEVRTIHARDRSTWALNMLEDGAGMTIEGTSGAARVPGLATPDVTVTKTRDSAFHGTDLADVLAAHEVDRLVLCGVSTESCIAATATEAYARDLRVILVRDGTASVDAEQHEQTLAMLHQQYRQPVMESGDISF